MSFAYPAACRTDGGSCQGLWNGGTGYPDWASPAVGGGVVYTPSEAAARHGVDTAEARERNRRVELVIELEPSDAVLCQQEIPAETVARAAEFAPRFFRQTVALFGEATGRAGDDGKRCSQIV